MSEELIVASVVSPGITSLVDYLEDKTGFSKQKLEDNQKILDSDIYEVERRGIIDEIWIYGDGEECDLEITLRSKTDNLFTSVLTGKKRVKFEIPFIKLMDTGFVEKLYLCVNSKYKYRLDVTCTNQKIKYPDYEKTVDLFYDCDNIPDFLITHTCNGKLEKATESLRYFSARSCMEKNRLKKLGNLTIEECSKRLKNSSL